MKFTISRRRFIGMMGVMVAAAGTGWRYLQGGGGAAAAVDPPGSSATRIGGFVVFGNDADVSLWSPLIRGGDSDPVEQLGPYSGRVATTELLSSVAELRKATGLTVYDMAPAALPAAVKLLSVAVVRNADGKVTDASIVYARTDGSLEVPVIRLTARTRFPTPVPIVVSYVGAMETPVPGIEVKGLPGPAVASLTASGQVIRWIENNILYSCTIETGDDLPKAIDLAANLSAA